LPSASARCFPAGGTSTAAHVCETLIDISPHLFITLEKRRCPYECLESTDVLQQGCYHTFIMRFQRYELCIGATCR
jgi:hypothetical protein